MRLKDFEGRIQAYVAMLYAVAFALTRHPVRAETLTVHTIEEAFRRREQLGHRVWPKAWLLTMLRNLFIANYYVPLHERPVSSCHSAPLVPVGRGFQGCAGKPQDTEEVWRNEHQSAFQHESMGVASKPRKHH